MKEPEIIWAEFSGANNQSMLSPDATDEDVENYFRATLTILGASLQTNIYRLIRNLFSDVSPYVAFAATTHYVIELHEGKEGGENLLRACVDEFRVFDQNKEEM